MGEHDKRYFVICASITNFAQMPETPDKRRCVLHPSGFEIVAKGKGSLVAYRLHLTSESVNIVTADLLGETDELFESMTRISKCIKLCEHKMRLMRQINKLPS